MIFFKLQLLILSAVVALYGGGCDAAAAAADADVDVDCSKRPERVNPILCCPIPELISDEIKEKCKAFDTPPSPPPLPPMSEDSTSNDEGNDVQERGKKQRRPHHHHHHHHHHPHHNPCFASCVFNETGIYVDKKLDEAKLKNYLQIVLKNSTDLQDAISESFNTCVAKIDKFKGQGRRPSPPPVPASVENDAALASPSSFCPHSAGRLMGCVFKTTFKNCPKSIWNDTQQCNDLRAHFEQCKHMHGPHGPPPDGASSMSPDEV